MTELFNLSSLNDDDLMEKMFELQNKLYISKRHMNNPVLEEQLLNLIDNIRLEQQERILNTMALERMKKEKKAVTDIENGIENTSQKEKKIHNSSFSPVFSKVYKNANSDKKT